MVDTQLVSRPNKWTVSELWRCLC